MPSPTGRVPLVLALLLLAGCSRATRVEPPPLVSRIQPLGDSSGSFDALIRAIGDRRIVLLGENGHGVGQFSALKARIVEELHRRLGFEVVAIESGYYDCLEADARLVARTTVQAFRDCLAYVMEHAQILPLFEYARTVRERGGGLTIAGIDLQAQGATTLTRPAALRLAGLNDAAAADSAMLQANRAGGDTLRQWLGAHGRAALAVLDSAVIRSPRQTRWTVATAAALLRRLLVRGEAHPDSTPAAFYESRDDWMARTVSWLADSTGRPRKVVVWLHNDHARYGLLDTPAGPVEAAGSMLRRRYGSTVFSVGFFMGTGSVTNNSRVVRPMLPMPNGGIEALFAQAGHGIALLLLEGRGGQPLPYLRNGLALDSLRPGAEFDALVYVHEVAPPSYRLP